MHHEYTSAPFPQQHQSNSPANSSSQLYEQYAAPSTQQSSQPPPQQSQQQPGYHSLSHDTRSAETHITAASNHVSAHQYAPTSNHAFHNPHPSLGAHAHTLEPVSEYSNVAWDSLGAGYRAESSTSLAAAFGEFGGGYNNAATSGVEAPFGNSGPADYTGVAGSSSYGHYDRAPADGSSYGGYYGGGSSSVPGVESYGNLSRGEQHGAFAGGNAAVASQMVAGDDMREVQL